MSHLPRASWASAAARSTGAWRSMDFRRKFEFGLAWRTIVLIGAVLLVAKAATTPGVRAGLVVATVVGVIALASLWNFIRRTNFLVSRFVERVRFEDYSQ